MSEPTPAQHAALASYPRAERPRGDLFQLGSFRLHSGAVSDWKIEADSLTDAEIRLFARLIVQRYQFRVVVGVPRGGSRLAAALRSYCRPDGCVLLVDDVLTSGASMEELRQKFSAPDVRGVVLFARGAPPAWVEAVFQMWRPR